LDLLLGGHRQQPFKVLGQGGTAEVAQAQLAQGFNHLVSVKRLPVAVVVFVQQVAGIQLAQTIEVDRQIPLGAKNQAIGLAKALKELPGGVERRQAIPEPALQAADAVLERHH
jgi:hypothetical protein